MDRRTFFMAAGAPLMAQSPSEIDIGVIGTGGRGQYLMKLAAREQGVRILGLCDPYQPNLEAALTEAGGQAKIYPNYKALLANKDLNVVIIATPEHWHHRMLLDAMAAGKDVYVEKPLCHTPEEGLELVRASKKSSSIVQVGMQRRSYDLYLKARDVRKSGVLGQVRMVRSWWLNNNVSYRPRLLKGGLDWAQWQGPAKSHALDADRFFDWRSYSEYSGGIVADQGAHVFDGIHMIMAAGYPTAVNASAGRIHRAGIDTPESVIVTAEYPQDFVAVFTINYAAMHYRPVNDQMNHFDGDKARLDVGRQSYAVYNEGTEDTPSDRMTSGGMEQATVEHIRNFLACVRSRNTPAAPVETAFQAALIPQLANISLKEGKRIHWPPDQR